MSVCVRVCDICHQQRAAQQTAQGLLCCVKLREIALLLFLYSIFPDFIIFTFITLPAKSRCFNMLDINYND